MTDKIKSNLRRMNLYTKEQLMDFFLNISLPEGVRKNIVEKNNYIEFEYNGTIYSTLIDGQNWEEVKQELLRQKEQRQMENKRIKELEKQDNLTGLYNKDYSRKIIEGFLQNSESDAHHALMIVDIDNFDTINESLGYLFGDTVLVNIADALRKNFYDTDIAGRIGGDEFLIFVKNISDPELLREKAKRINSVFKNTYTGEDKNYKMSCSIGIAVYPEDGLDYQQLFIKADAALMHTRKTQEDFYTFYDCIEKPHEYIDTACFEKYMITKTKAYGSSNFDKEITAFAFDIMSRTKDVNSAINLLLNKVRVQFDCGQICIFENNIDFSDYQLTYFCSADGMRVDPVLDEQFHETLHNRSLHLNEDGTFYIIDSDLLEIEEREHLESLGIKALIQCGIFENGVRKGCVSIHDMEKPRYWTQYELDSLVTITRVISSYLLKMRASERANRQLYNLRNFDSITGLPTLHKFKKDVRELISTNTDKKFALIYSDLSQFKYINNTLGYDTGDKILCDFASLISGREANNEIVARVSEDNFIAVRQFHSEELLVEQIMQVHEQFNTEERLKYPGTKFIVFSGISLIDNEENLSIAIDNANIARKSIKNQSKMTCKFFDLSMKQKLQWEAEINNCMEQALKDREFIVYLQPKVGLSDSHLVGAEALVRWKRNNVLIPPNDFIPIFENNGFVVNLDFFVYEEVCKMIKNWLDEGHDVVPISVNVSRIHLNDEKFVYDIKDLVDAYEIPYHLLELEITESIFLNNTEVALATMRELRSLGFGVSIDDFGAGYSSLNLLKDMATDVIKLDKEFFGRGDMQKEERIILSSIISMAKQLNMKVLSEGVETQSQSDFLKSVMCDMAQGYLYSRPIPIAEFENIMFRGNDNLLN